MSYYIATCSTNRGRRDLAIWVDYRETIAEAVDREARRLDLIACHDWGAQPVSEGDFDLAWK